MPDEERLRQVLLHFAQTLVTDYRIDEMLDNLCSDVVDVLDVGGAGVMLEGDDGQLHFVAASDDRVREIESLQIELDEGPCVHAYRTGERVVVADLERSARFPVFAPRAVKAGLIGVYSFPMRQDDETVGALNLYRSSVQEFTDVDSDAGQLLADLATTYILNARTHDESVRLAEQLQHALDSRVLIEQAKGVLAERHQIPVRAAFERLRRYARHGGRKLHDVARGVVDDGLDIPDV